MNYRTIGSFLSNVLKIEAALLLLPIITSIIYHESVGIYYLLTAAIILIVGILFGLKKEGNPNTGYNRDEP